MTAHQYEAGPSSHPRGPPGLGGQPGPLRTPPMSAARTPPSDDSPGDMDGRHGSPTGSNGGGSAGGGSGRTRSGRAANMSNDEWARQRKDNHASPSLLTSSFFVDRIYRKKSNAADAEISTKASTNSGASSPMAPAKRPKAPSSPEPSSTSII